MVSCHSDRTHSLVDTNDGSTKYKISDRQMKNYIEYMFLYQFFALIKKMELKKTEIYYFKGYARNKKVSSRWSCSCDCSPCGCGSLAASSCCCSSCCRRLLLLLQAPATALLQLLLLQAPAAVGLPAAKLLLLQLLLLWLLLLVGCCVRFGCCSC